ncbi:ATP phosphoribosyltransferase regulatory subunit [Chloroflexota bacterium]
MREQKCKGCKDLFPEQMRAFRLIEGIFRDCCLKWGYEEVRTPTIEYLHLFTATGTLTPSRLRRVYSFLDWDGWSGERVVVRPDGTIPIARLYIESMAERDLAKLFYVTNIFTFEETGKETREKWQCGSELIGASGTLADIELITMALEVLNKLGLDSVDLRISHAGLIKALLTKFVLNPTEQVRLFDQILDGDVEALAKLKPDKPELGRALTPLFNLKGKSPGFLKNLRVLFNRDLPELETPFNNFINIVDHLETLGYSYQIDVASGRDFEYYTGIMFRLLANGEHVGGGGRYDALIPLLGGKDTPASGFALYLNRLMNLINLKAFPKPPAERILIKAEPHLLTQAFSLVRFLHEAGYMAELYLGQESINPRWILDVLDQAPLFVLTDQVSYEKFEFKTVDKVLDILKKDQANRG